MTSICLKCRSERGFTLIEVIVFIIVIGLFAGMLVPFTVGHRGSPSASLAQKGIDLAQAELEQTVAQKRANGFGALATGGCVTPMLAGFICTRTVCYVPLANLNDTSACGTATNYKRVEVKITNTAIGDVTAVTLFTNY